MPLLDDTVGAFGLPTIGHEEEIATDDPNAARRLAGTGVIVTVDQRTLGWKQKSIFLEGFQDVLQVVKIIKMIRLDARHENPRGVKIQEVASVLARFGNEVAFPLHERGSVAEPWHLRADNHGDGKRPLLEDASTEGSGGGLAMHAANAGGVGGH